MKAKVDTSNIPKLNLLGYILDDSATIIFSTTDGYAVTVEFEDESRAVLLYRDGEWFFCEAYRAVNPFVCVD